MSRYVNAKGTGRSSGTRVLLRMTGGFLSVCLNVVIYVVLIYFLILRKLLRLLTSSTPQAR